MKQDYLMLAHSYKRSKHNISGYYVSEKLDGSRAFWDGGCSRGMLATNVPYANRIKDDRLKVSPIATGLWSRSGKVIHAPDWWLNDLPDCPLDGELWLGRGKFQELRKTIGQHIPDSRWRNVCYMVFDSPSWEAFTKPRDIKIRNEYEFWVTRPDFQPNSSINENWTFELVRHFLKSKCLFFMLGQERLPLNFIDASDRITEKLDEITKVGGEGVILRNPSSFWVTQRSHNLLKVKKWKDAEGVLIGYTAGKGKYRGMIGALVLDFNGKRLELSGMTDEERMFTTNIDKAKQYPGCDMPNDTGSKYFLTGQKITFKYRELSNDGVPKEGRYYR